MSSALVIKITLYEINKMCENNRNSMLLGDPAWQVSPRESLGKLQAYERIVISLRLQQCCQMLSRCKIINNRCLKIGVL